MTLEEILAALQAIIDGAKSDGDRPLTDEEVQRYEELEGQLKAVQQTQDIQRRQAAYQTPVFNTLRTRSSDEDTTEEQREFRAAFMAGKLMDLAEFRAQSSSTTAGGYTIPASFREKLVERQVAFGGVVANAEQITTDDWTPMPFPTNDDTSNSAEVVAENAAPASAGADIVFGTKSLDAYRIVASGASNTWLKVPVQLMDSSYLDWENFVTRKLGERLGRKEAALAVSGTGSGEPQGILTGLTSSDEVASNTTGPTYPELLAAEQVVDIAYRDMGNCKWYMHSAIWALIRGLLDNADRPIILEQAVAGIGTGVQRMLLGYPVVLDNSFPSSWGDQAKTLVFGDLREAFVVRRVKNPAVVSDPLQFFLNGQVGFLAASGFGSLVQDPNAATVISGANV
jgi:HK97 family phage major capsid protein